MEYQELVEGIARTVAEEPPRGEVASYIPELARVPADRFGISLRRVGGGLFRAGDSEERFSIQSIAKVPALALAMREDDGPLWRRVGVEPSGNPFNSLVLLEVENGVPRNPLINAGGIVVADLLVSRFARPREALLDFVRELAGSEEVDIDERVARSEAQSGFRNRAMAWLMRDFGNVENDVEEVLELYFHMCAIGMSCTELARAFSFLADRGRPPGAERSLLSDVQVQRVNALMLTCGFYDEAGEFAFRVGLPGKSGVGGGIVAVHPGYHAVAVWSPRLNAKGNSEKGLLALRLLAERTGASVF